MTRILVLSYTQSGDVARVTRAFIEPLERPGVEVVHHPIRPTSPYPFPWQTLVKLVDVMPECVAGIAPSIEPLPLAPGERFDLVILSYQVWHFSPSLPVQGFLASAQAEVLRGTRVVTLVTSRNMWQSASRTMCRLLADRGAVHIDNVVITHAGPPWTTFITVPRALLFGKKDPLWGIFPSAEIGPGETARLARLGARLGDEFARADASDPQPLLTGCDAVVLERRFILPEFIACRGARLWSRVLRRAGAGSSWLRRVLIHVYLVYLVLMIVVGLPVAIVLLVVSYPFIKERINRYALELTRPSGGSIH